MKGIILSIIIMLGLIGGTFWLSKTGAGSNNKSSLTELNNVSIIDGVQIIEIEARGGYQPRKSYAKAGMPTVIRFSTNGTFDCSSSVRIPSLNLYKNLPQSGKTDLDIGNPKISTLKGSCGMGMYPFEVEFTS